MKQCRSSSAVQMSEFVNEFVPWESITSIETIDTRSSDGK